MVGIRSWLGWWITSTCAPIQQATSNPTNKNQSRKSMASLPLSWSSTEPYAVVAVLMVGACMTGEDYSVLG